MRARVRLAAVAGAVLSLLAGDALGARRAAVPHISFTGSYAVTYRVTNTKSPPTHWVEAVTRPCASPCRSVTFRQRLTTEKAWGKRLLVYTWGGSGYVLTPYDLRNRVDCRGTRGRTARKGYDVRGTQTIRVAAVTSGRVVRFTGTGKDAYAPNSAGRRAGCVAGAYVFAITGTIR